MGWIATTAAADTLSAYAAAEVLVRWKGGTAKPTKASFAALEALRLRYGLVAETRLVPQTPAAGTAKAAAEPALYRWSRLQLSSREDPQTIARDFAQLELVEYAQPNFLRRETAWPSDSLFAQQWNLAALGWERGVVAVESTAGIVVAVIDSGLDFDHPDIVSQIWNNGAEVEGVSGVDDDGNGYVDDLIGWDFSHAPGLPGEGDYLQRDNQPWDESGHGTHVSGIIAATVDNGIGIAGVAPGVRLMPLRAGFNLPQGSFLEDDDIAAAIIYAVDNGAHIINMSWGSPQFSPLIRDAVRHAAQAGCILVAAAGNEGGGPVFIPARLDETIAVAAADPQGRILSFSIPGYSIDLAAPGQNILSLAPGAGYATRSGTSMAAPHISGLAALILARSPHFSPEEVRGALVASAKDIGTPGWDPRAGSGLAQIDALYFDRAPGIRLEVVGDGALVEAGREVRLILTGAGFTHYELSWGVGENPFSWQVLEETEVTGPGVYKAAWNVAGLAPGPYLLRAQVLWQGRRLEERVVVQVAHSGPRLRDLGLSRVLDGPSWKYLVEWETDLPAGGSVNLFGVGEQEVLYEVAAVAEQTAQRVLLPPQLSPGVYRVQIKAEVEPDFATVAEIADFEVAPRAFSQWRFREIAHFPDGYLLGQFSDLNGNGVVELVQMGYSGRHYNATEVYEYQGGTPEQVHSSSRLFIPWNVHDLDADGLVEIMAVDAQRVRLLEAGEKGGFPERVSWEGRDVWGGEIGDLDGDGRSEMYLRSSRSNLFQVFEATGDDRFEEIATLPNPTQGDNELGERQVVADFDGDGRGEFLAGDGDGDLFVFEGIADNALRSTWREKSVEEGADARVVGGGVDLDGDGRVEFIVARLFQNPFAPLQTHWVVSVYQNAGDNVYSREWQVEVLGGKAGGNGISVGDLDGDGKVEFVLALAPHLYVFQATAVDEYEPVWHQPATDTFRPAVGDLDGTGKAELAFNTAGKVAAFTLEQDPEGLVAPAGFTGYALDQMQIVLEWDPVTAAAAYRVYRDGELRAGPLTKTGYEDVGVKEGVTYFYSVAALDSSLEIEGSRTVRIALKPEEPPRIREVERLTRHQIAVMFDSAMDISYEMAYLYRVEPGVGSPASVFADLNARRAVLSFTAALPDSGRFVLAVRELRNLRGTPLAADSRQVEFGLEPVREPVRVLTAEVLSATQVRLVFSRGIALPPDSTGVFFFENSPILVRRVQVREEREVVLELEEATPLQALGQRYRIRIQGLLDDSGRPMDARASFSYAAADLSLVKVFPNPFFPAQGGLKFAGLTPDSRVHIYDLSGRQVRLLLENDGDGGVRWDGVNSAGKPVHTGVYLYRVVSVSQVRQGKFALVRK